MMKSKLEWGNMVNTDSGKTKWRQKRMNENI